MLDRLKAKGFEVVALHHAEAILKHDMPDALDELEEALDTATIPTLELIKGGGGEGALTQRTRRSLCDSGWIKHNFVVKKIVDGVEKESISHEIDHVKKFPTGTCALEIEWNNKDPFFDRDLENFKRLHADGVISVGMIVTRGSTLHDGLREIIEDYAVSNNINRVEDIRAFYTPTARQIKNIEAAEKSRGTFQKGWSHAFVSDKFGEATTHWKKLEDRVHRGVGNPCPLLLIGLPRDIVT